MLKNKFSALGQTGIAPAININIGSTDIANMKLASHGCGRVWRRGTLLRDAERRSDEDEQQQEGSHLHSTPASVFVACVAIHTVIDVSGHAIVLGIGSRRRVTVGTGEHSVVG